MALNKWDIENDSDILISIANNLERIANSLETIANKKVNNNG